MPAVAEQVAILEDDPNRITAMRACVTETLPGIEVVVFDDAREMIGWLGRNLGDVVLTSLDHDLPLRGHEGKTIDCGTGREVADYLASVPPTLHRAWCSPSRMPAGRSAGFILVMIRRGSPVHGPSRCGRTFVMAGSAPVEPFRENSA